MNAPRLKLADLAKSFAALVALDGVSLEIMPGSAVGVLGPNGCGRTVLIDTICGLHNPDRGHITLVEPDGGQIDLTDVAPPERIELGIARTWQEIRLVGGLTALDEVLLGGYARRDTSMLSAALGIPAARRDLARARDRARNMLDLVGLADRAASLADRLSRAEQMRVGIARALTSQPDLLLLDAPGGGLADTELASLGDLIQVLREAGISVLVADRSMSLIAQCCDQAIALDAGRVIAAGRPDECFANPRVQQAYFGTGSAPAC